MSREKSKIVILNGASSAGKTSMSKALQSILTEEYLLMGIDLFWMQMPPKQLDLITVEPHYYTWHKEIVDDRPFLRIVPADGLNRMMRARYKAIASYLEEGFNIIADDVTWTKQWLDDALEILEPYEVHFVGVYCEDRVLSHREILRGDRLDGWARGSQKWAHEHLIYDIVLDTTLTTIQESAQKVARYIESGEKPQAAEKMRLRG